MIYTVHLYVAARVQFEGIEAETHKAAIEIAETWFNPNNFFMRDADPRKAAVWDEGAPLGAMVDEEGDEEEYLNSTYHALAGTRNYV